MTNFEKSILKSYFENIIAACHNKDKDERPYIEGVAECGLDIINGLFDKKG